MTAAPATQAHIEQLKQGVLDTNALTAIELDELARALNDGYRAGAPFVPDAIYDTQVIAVLAEKAPDSPFLHEVEPEGDTFGDRGIRHATPMLSTEKAYGVAAATKKFVIPVRQAAEEMGIDPADVRIRITAKLDGIAASDDGRSLATRGDGRYGADISYAFARGLVIWGGEQTRGLGAGEIVVPASYFNQALASDFEYPRNFITGAINADEPSPLAEIAFAEGMVQFVPYVRLPSVEVTLQDLIDRFDELFAWAGSSVDYVTDGAVVDVIDPAIRQHMGHSRRHHRWQVALKANTEFAETTVLRVVAQTGRTGQITPVAEYEPMQISGALCSRATLHHYGNVRAAGIGAGARIRIVRSGAVIPTLVGVLQPVTPSIPDGCPSCGAPPVWHDDFLFCENTASCPAQRDRALIHFFSTMNNCDGFGPATIRRITDNGITSLQAIFALTEADFVGFGFGEVQAANNVRELDRCRRQAVEDWRFLAAFGINSLGRGSSENLLQHFALLDLLDASAADIQAIDGFGKVTGPLIADGLARVRDEILSLHALGFNLETTPLLADGGSAESPITGKHIVFTGSMKKGSRDDMKKHAKALGAKVQSDVNSKTNYLVCGDNVGARKTEGAATLGVTVITEDEYLQMLGA